MRTLLDRDIAVERLARRLAGAPEEPRERIIDKVARYQLDLRTDLVEAVPATAAISG